MGTALHIQTLVLTVAAIARVAILAVARPSLGRLAPVLLCRLDAAAVRAAVHVAAGVPFVAVGAGDGLVVEVVRVTDAAAAAAVALAVRAAADCEAHVLADRVEGELTRPLHARLTGQR